MADDWAILASAAGLWRRKILKNRRSSISNPDVMLGRWKVVLSDCVSLNSAVFYKGQGRRRQTFKRKLAITDTQENDCLRQLPPWDWKTLPESEWSFSWRVNGCGRLPERACPDWFRCLAVKYQLADRPNAAAAACWASALRWTLAAKIYSSGKLMHVW